MDTHVNLPSDDSHSVMSSEAADSDNEEMPATRNEILADVTIDNVDTMLQKEFGMFHAAMRKTKLAMAFKDTYPRLFPIITKFGVSEDQLVVLLDLIFSQKLGVSHANKLIQLLLPRGKVPVKHIFRIAANLSCRIYNAKTMARLLKWMVTVYDLIEPAEYVSNLYSVFFHYLSMETLRPQLCHLLYFMTKRAHVKPFRVHYLMELIDQVGVEPHLYGLLSIYKNYYPDITMPSSTYRAKLIFTHPAPGAKEALQNIRAIWQSEQTGDLMDLHKPSLENPRTKRRRQVMVPSTATTDVELRATTIQEIDDSQHLAEKIDKLELPDQMASVLDNRLLQHVLVCDPKATTIARVSHWLSQSLLDAVKWNNHTPKSKATFMDLLHKLISLARFTKSQLPVLETFLRDYLTIWNGVDFEKELFELIAYVKPSSFEDIYHAFLRPLFRLYCVCDATWKARLILCYTEWLKNWAILDWGRHARQRHGIDLDVDASVDEMIWLFEGLSYNVDYFRTIQHFTEHVDHIAVLGLELEDDCALLQHASLSFFELASSISMRHNVPEIIIPHSNFVYRSFFSPNAMAVSRICGIIHQYKREFDADELKTDDWVSRHTTDYVEHFNSYVMGICNCLWRNLAFDHSGAKAGAFSITKEITMKYNEICEARGEQLDYALSLTHSACFAGFAKRFVRGKEEAAGVSTYHKGPITSHLLKSLSKNDGLSLSFSDFRIEYLDHLNDLGFGGVYGLLYASMTSLIRRAQGQESMVSTSSVPVSVSMTQ